DPEILPWRKIDNLRKRWLGTRSLLLSLSILYRDRFRGTGCRRLCPRAGCSLCLSARKIFAVHNGLEGKYCLFTHIVARLLASLFCLALPCGHMRSRMV